MQQNFKYKDRVRLKDSPYEGEVVTLGVGGLSFKTDKGEHISVSHDRLVEHVFDPKPGDIYRDKNGREWVIRSGNPTYSSEPYLLAMLVDTQPKDRTGYPYTQMLLQKPEKIAGWAKTYKPELLRRRDS